MLILSRLSILFYLCISLLFFPSPAQSKAPTRGPVPHWVILHPVPEKSAIDPNQLTGGFHYLLIDVQKNLAREQNFYHYAIRIISGDGIQEISDIDVTYDPSYQSLQFNMVRLHRDGRIIDNLSTHEIKSFQRESGYDRYLLDGSLTALINQENVRIGDVIEYAYTLTGRNPIHAGDFHSVLFQQFTIPIQQYSNRLISPENSPLHFRYSNNAIKPDIQRNNGLIEYSWELRNIAPYSLQDNTPYWYDPYPQIQISSQDQWSEVVQWALPLYGIDAHGLEALSQMEDPTKSAVDQDDRILKTIRFVQNEVRYLGMEGGLGAYRPNQPEVVFQRRFGDCKDKSLLLTAMLRNLGLSAWPVLVNTELKAHVRDRIPSSRAFNHCIVKFEYHGDPVFIDPTISNQGGDLSHLAIPDYGVGLVIDTNVSDLENLPASEPGSTVIEYFFTLKELLGPAELSVTTTYGGLTADRRRGYFLSQSHAAIGKASLDYYSNVFPGITEQRPLKLVNLTKNSVNLISTEEHFLIEDFWETSPSDSNLISADFYPLELVEIVDVPASAGRTAPYDVGEKLDIKINVVFLMPSDWPVEEQLTEISSDDYSYSSELKGSLNRIDLSFHYRRLNDYITAENTKSFIAEHDLIYEDLFLTLSHDSTNEDFQFSWLALTMSVVILFLGFLAVRRIHIRYDPAPLAFPEQPLPFGGWLILPLIGFSIRPVIALWGVFGDSVFFNQNTWNMAISNESYWFITKLGLLLISEFILGLIYIVFSIFVAIQFFKKRSSLPRLAIILLLGSLIQTGLDTALSYSFLNGTDMSQLADDNRSTLFGSIFGCLVWIPYFLTSSRVKNTFVRQLRPTQEQIPTHPMAQSTSLPGTMVYSAVILGSMILGEIVFFLKSQTLVSFFISNPAPSEASGGLVASLTLFLAILLLPVMGLFGIINRKTWARRLTVIVFSLVVAFLFIIAISSILSDPPEDVLGTIIGVLMFAAPPSVGLVLLFLRPSAVDSPSQSSLQATESDDSWDYPNHCRDLTSEIFDTIRASFPGLKMVPQEDEPDKPFSMVIPLQTGIPRQIILSLQNTDTLNLSIGPARMSWEKCNFDGVRNEFQATVFGLLDGSRQYVEHLKDDELTGAEIRIFRNDKWEKTCRWIRSRGRTNWGSTQQIVEFKAPENSSPNED